jgi:hypothetical protein
VVSNSDVRNINAGLRGHSVLPLWLDAQIGHQDKPAEKGRKGPPYSSRCPYPGVWDILPLLMLVCIILS